MGTRKAPHHLYSLDITPGIAAFAARHFHGHHVFCVGGAIGSGVRLSVYFTSGVILAFLGMLGRYVGRVFDVVKARPLFVIREMTFRE